MSEIYFNMGRPEWIVVVLGSISIVLHLVMHGKPVALHRHKGVQRVIGILITFLLLYWGGFFQ